MNNRTKIERYLTIIIGLAFSSVFLFSFRSCYQQEKDRKEILAYRAFTQGVIVEYSHSGISDHGVTYEYVVNGKKYTKSHGMEYLPCAKFGYGYCKGKKYPVIYSRLHPEKSYLLASKYSYKLFHLKVPDHLK